LGFPDWRKGAWRMQKISARWLSHRCSNESARPRFLYKSDDPNVPWIRAGLEFHLHILAKAFSFLQPSYLVKLLHNRNVGKVPATIFPVQDFGLYPIESDNHVNIGVMFLGAAIRFNMGTKYSRLTAVNLERFDVYQNLGRGCSFLKNLLHLLRIAGTDFTGSIYDELRGVRGLQPKSAYVRILAVGQRSRGVWIPPTVMVPIVHVLAEDDQLRASHWLGSVHLFE
jgi:hypothetical protein